MVRNLRLGTYRRNKNFKVAHTNFPVWGVHCARLSQSTLYAQDLTENNMAACCYFCAIFLHFSVRLLLAHFKYNSRSSHSVYTAESFFNNIFQKYNYFYAQLIFESYVTHTTILHLWGFLCIGSKDAEVTKSVSVLQAKK